MSEKPEATKTELCYLFASLISCAVGLGLIAYYFWQFLLTAVESKSLLIAGAVLVFVGLIFVGMLERECYMVHGELLKTGEENQRCSILLFVIYYS